MKKKTTKQPLLTIEQIEALIQMSRMNIPVNLDSDRWQHLLQLAKERLQIVT